MHVLWEHPASTVGEVVERMVGPARPAYNSVLTILRILEQKGYVSHEKSGRAFVYSAVVDRQQARRGALSMVLSRFFNGSREALLMDPSVTRTLMLRRSRESGHCSSSTSPAGKAGGRDERAARLAG